MENKIIQAQENYGTRGNCAQAILYTFKDEIGLDEETLKALGMGFGSGGGASLKSTCGALNGAIMVFNLLNKDMPRAKAYTHTRNMINKFEEQNTTINCGVLKGATTRVPLKACPLLVADATKILIEELESI